MKNLSGLPNITYNMLIKFWYNLLKTLNDRKQNGETYINYGTSYSPLVKHKMDKFKIIIYSNT